MILQADLIRLLENFFKEQGLTINVERNRGSENSVSYPHTRFLFDEDNDTIHDIFKYVVLPALRERGISLSDKFSKGNRDFYALKDNALNDNTDIQGLADTLKADMKAFQQKMPIMNNLRASMEEMLPKTSESLFPEEKKEDEAADPLSDIKPSSKWDDYISTEVGDEIFYMTVFDADRFLRRGLTYSFDDMASEANSLQKDVQKKPLRIFRSRNEAVINIEGHSWYKIHKDYAVLAFRMNADVARTLKVTSEKDLYPNMLNSTTTPFLVSENGIEIKGADIISLEYGSRFMAAKSRFMINRDCGLIPDIIMNYLEDELVDLSRKAELIANAATVFPPLPPEPSDEKMEGASNMSLVNETTDKMGELIARFILTSAARYDEIVDSPGFARHLKTLLLYYCRQGGDPEKILLPGWDNHEISKIHEAFSTDGEERWSTRLSELPGKLFASLLESKSEEGLLDSVPASPHMIPVTEPDEIKPDEPVDLPRKTERVANAEAASPLPPELSDEKMVGASNVSVANETTDNLGEVIAKLILTSATLYNEMDGSPDLTRHIKTLLLYYLSEGGNPENIFAPGWDNREISKINEAFSADGEERWSTRLSELPRKLSASPLESKSEEGQLHSVHATLHETPVAEPDEKKPTETEPVLSHSHEDENVSINGKTPKIDIPLSNAVSSEPSQPSPDQEAVVFLRTPSSVNREPAVVVPSSEPSLANLEQSAALLSAAPPPVNREPIEVVRSRKPAPANTDQAAGITPSVPAPPYSRLARTAADESSNQSALESRRYSNAANQPSLTASADAKPASRVRPAPWRLSGGLLVAGGVALTVCAIVFPPSAVLFGCLAGAAYLAGFAVAAIPGFKDRRSRNLQTGSDLIKNAKDESSQLDSPKIMSNHSYLKNIFSQRNAVNQNAKTMVNDEDLHATAGPANEKTGISSSARKRLRINISNHGHSNDHQSPSNSRSGPNHHSKG